MRSTSQVMEHIRENEFVREQFSMVYALSLPMLAAEDGADATLAVLVYQPGLPGANAANCIGHLRCGFGEKDDTQFFLRAAEPADLVAHPLSIVRNPELLVASRQEYLKLQKRLYALLDGIRPYAFTAPAMMVPEQMLCVKDYLELFCSLTGGWLLRCCYAVNPDFFDWCCCALYEL